jgi:ribulose-5-phosphate 4-epimerase/fuculose-1-phosphate aldolase
MILRNHGLLTCGATPAGALTLMRYLVQACEIQLALQATGQEITLPSPAVCEHTARQMERYQGQDDDDQWRAYLRIVQGLDASFKV